MKMNNNGPRFEMMFTVTVCKMVDGCRVVLTNNMFINVLTLVEPDAGDMLCYLNYTSNSICAALLLISYHPGASCCEYTKIYPLSD